MDSIVFKVDLFGDKGESTRSRRSLLFMMEALASHNILWLLNHPSTPYLYESSVIYRPEVGETWKDIFYILADGFGDCEDLACWRIAELRHAGINARPYIKWVVRDSKTRMHALVRWPDGRVEDPSRALGMNGPIIRAPVFV